jgi:hypothetical protein
LGHSRRPFRNSYRNPKRSVWLALAGSCLKPILFDGAKARQYAIKEIAAEHRKAGIDRRLAAASVTPRLPGRPQEPDYVKTLIARVCAMVERMAAAPTKPRQRVRLYPNGRPAAPRKQLKRVRLPIVFANVADPVASGIVPRPNRPGGNITGFANYEAIAPGLKRAAIMFNPDFPPVSAYMASLETAARSLKVEAIIAPVHSDAEIETGRRVPSPSRSVQSIASARAMIANSNR